MQIHTSDSVSRRDQLVAMRAANPHLRTVDAAAHLGTSEAELLDAFAGCGATPLQPRWKEMMPEMPQLGPVLVLTRNPSVVIETTGCFDNVAPEQGIVLGAQVDLRLFFDRWRFAFALDDTPSAGFRRSLQFFDDRGRAVLKVVANEQTDCQRFDEFVARWSLNPVAAVLTEAQPALNERRALDVDVEQLRTEWRAMHETHDVFELLRRYRLRRSEALPLLGEEIARSVTLGGLRFVLETAAASQTPLMVFVGNPGAIQIYTGQIGNVRTVGPWLNVLDPHFNLHVHEAGLDNAWVVRRPTPDGVVTSLDVFDRDGELAVQLFGKRKPGQPEREDWRDLAGAIS